MRRVLAFSVSMALAGACSSYDEDPPAAPLATDAGVDAAAAAVDSGADVVVAAVDAGADTGAPGPCAAHVIHVSSDGSDLNTGCDPTKPKRTIGGAIAYLASSALTGFEIHVCRGTYAEAVTLDIPASLRGSYECSTWKQDADLAAPVNQTILQPPSGGRVLTVSGASIDSTFTIEGLILRAPDVVQGTSIALSIEDNAAPHVAWIDAQAGAVAKGGGAEGQSIGLQTVTGASPKIDHSVLKAGDATCTTSCNKGYGSVAVRFLSGSPSIVDSTLIPGKTTFAEVGSTTYGSANVGLLTVVPLQGERAAARNTVFLAGAVAVYGYVSYGFLANADIEIVDSTISRNATPIDCSATGAAEYCGAIGVFVAKNRTARISRLRMDDPNVKANRPVRHGVHVAGGTAEIEASAIYLSAPGALSRALNMETGTIRARGNTFVAETLLRENGGIAELSDNLHVQTFGTGLPPPAFAAPNEALMVVDCAQRGTITLANNAFVQGSASPPGVLALWTDAACAKAGLLTMKEAELALNARPESVASSNVIVRSSCAGEDVARCVTCASGGGCVFADWGADPYKSNAASQLLGAGFPLKPTVDCKIGTGGTSGLITFSPKDIRGQLRTPPPSIGAFDSDVCGPADP